MTTAFVGQMRAVAALIGGGALIAVITMGWSWPLTIAVLICGMILSFTSAWTAFESAHSEGMLSLKTRCILVILVEAAFWSVVLGLIMLIALGWSHTAGYRVLLALGAALLVPSMRIKQLCSVSSLGALVGEIGLIGVLTLGFLFLVSL